MESFEAEMCATGRQKNMARLVFSTPCLADHSSCASRDEAATMRSSGRATAMCFNLRICLSCPLRADRGGADGGEELIDEFIDVKASYQVEESA